MLDELEHDEVKRLLSDIRDKAEGVFLWVKYGLHSISEGIRGIDDLRALEMPLS